MTTNAYLLPVAAGARPSSPSRRSLFSRYRIASTLRRLFLLAAVLLALLALLRTIHHPDSPIPTPFSSTFRAAPADSSSGSDSDSHPSPSHTTTTTHPPASQHPLADLSTRPLRERLDYHFPYSPSDKFPAYIWQTWRSTPASSSFPDHLRAHEASWTELHPDFIHEVVTDDAAAHVLAHLYSAIPDVLAAYAALPRAVLKADFFRYLILLARGGIYTDIDTQALRPAVDWVPLSLPRDDYGLVVGIEADADRPDWRDWYSRRVQFCQWTIQAKPGHPVLRDVVARITEDALRRRDAGLLERYDDDATIEFTGPAAWTDTLFAFFNDPRYFDLAGSARNISWQDFTGMTHAKRVGDVVVLPITSFSPGVGHSGSLQDDDPMAFVKHHFEGMSLSSFLLFPVVVVAAAVAD